MKKLYIKPVTENFPMILEDFTTNSVEYYKEYIDDGDDWGDSIIIDPVVSTSFSFPIEIINT